MTTLRLLCLVFLFTGCYSMRVSDGIRVREDIARSTTRMEWDHTYYFPLEPRTPLVKMRQALVKEIDKEGGSSYHFYDLLLLRPSSHDLMREAYLILDDSIVVTLDLTSFNRELNTEIDEETGSALNANREEVRVVTGYAQVTKKSYKVEYNITQEVMDMLLKVETIQFRYYAGPDMITLPLSGYHLRQLKTLVEYRPDAMAVQKYSGSLFP